MQFFGHATWAEITPPLNVCNVLQDLDQQEIKTKQKKPTPPENANMCFLELYSVLYSSVNWVWSQLSVHACMHK